MDENRLLLPFVEPVPHLKGCKNHVYEVEGVDV